MAAAGSRRFRLLPLKVPSEAGYLSVLQLVVPILAASGTKRAADDPEEK